MAVEDALGSKIAKLKIEPFTDSKFSKKADIAPFETSITPERYSFSTKVVSQVQQPVNNTKDDSKFEKVTPQQLDLDILFDRTGVVPGYEAKAAKVEEDIAAFKKVILGYDGDIHKPYYLRISWGTLVFECILSELNVEYKLFKPNGDVLRAVAKAKFTEFSEAEKTAAEQNKKSPDLTHKRTVKEGDTLPLMTYRIYGDSKYYLHVAKVNGLANFRRLTPGQQLWFPPLEKRS
ncbi:MAG: LysM peptidoglycan-binding domain-containing protein [Flavobacteriia bacterium]|nr:LysM peptidoglycan-binding domain-containing protein [Flavobacteriia bacterium]